MENFGKGTTKKGKEINISYIKNSPLTASNQKPHNNQAKMQSIEQIHILKHAKN